MATRLEIAHGLIAERGRSSTSGDTLSVTRPTTGSHTRTKGILFLVVGTGIRGPRAREATALVAETIRHDYYYDESAGVPICLEKAIRGADRRLRSSREGSGLAPGSVGVAAAVVRNNELYLATAGPVEAYLARSARLLMPDRSSPTGLPSDESRPIEVWRGELSLGDAVLLVSRNVTETVGSEELKSAVLTLHPQAAAEHLHHLFVAAGGEGSDGVIVIEARELMMRGQRGVGPSALPGVYGDLSGAGSSTGGAALGSAMLGTQHTGFSLEGLIDRLWEAMPHRAARAQGLVPRTSRAETRRRAAMGALAIVAVVFLLGVFVILVPRGGDATPVERVASGDSALSVALDRAERADNLLATEPEAALEYYREAWTEVARARATGLSAPALDELERRVRTGMDSLYGAHTLVTETIAKLPDGADPVDLVEDSRKGALYIDRAIPGIVRVNTSNGKSNEVVLEGDKPASGGNVRIGLPTQLEDGGSHIVITDDQARPWRWSPSNATGAGTLARITLQGSPTFAEDHGDVAAYTPSTGGYRLYVADPAQNQVMRYQQTLDGSAFSEPSGYLTTPSAEVADVGQLYVDFDVYALIEDTVRRYEGGKYDGAFMLAEPRDIEDLRPGHAYVRMAGAGTANSGGNLYLYDEVHHRIVGFEKSDGSYLGQWLPGEDGPQMDDLRGMYVIPGKVVKKRRQETREPDTLVWMTPEGIYRSVLATD
jgi:hypothetical protein